MANQREQVAKEGPEALSASSGQSLADLSARATVSPTPAVGGGRASAAEVFARWNGWATLPDYAKLGFDSEGYVFSDGRRFSRQQSQLSTHLANELSYLFLARTDVSVMRQMFLHFRQRGLTDVSGSRRVDDGGFVGLELFVTFGVERTLDLNSHKIWERGVPSFAVELLTRRAPRANIAEKKDLLRVLGVTEYLLHDLDGDLLEVPTLLCRLVDDEYEELPLPGAETPDESRFLLSEVLGVEFRLGEHRTLRLRQHETGEDLVGHEAIATALLLATGVRKRSHAF